MKEYMYIIMCSNSKMFGFISNFVEIFDSI